MQIIIYPSDSSDHNPFLKIISQGMRSSGGTVISWKKRSKATKKTDIVFLHWPENKWAQKNKFFGSLSQCLFLWKIKKLKKNGAKIVWAAHNCAPHTWNGTLEKWIKHSQRLFSVIDATVHLSEASKANPAFHRLAHLSNGVVYHPHYDLVDQYVHEMHAGQINRLLMLGALAPRKQAFDVINAALAVLPLVVTGKSKDDSVKNKLLGKIESSNENNIHIIDKYLDEQSLYDLFDGNTGILLSQDDALNSGVMFLALSRGAPVICPRNPTNELYQQKFGSEWVRIYDMPLTTDQLTTLVCDPVSKFLPNLEAHSANNVGLTTVSFFKQLINK
jgi:hypothetical protein